VTIPESICELKGALKYPGCGCSQTLPACAQEMCESGVECEGGWRPGGPLGFLAVPSFLLMQSCLYSTDRLLSEDTSIAAPIRVAACGLQYIFDGGGFTLSGDGTSTSIPAMPQATGQVKIYPPGYIEQFATGPSCLVRGGVGCKRCSRSMSCVGWVYVFALSLRC